MSREGTRIEQVQSCVQMELLGHSFFAFVNAETDVINIVYKRKDGNYGMLEPEA